MTDNRFIARRDDDPAAHNDPTAPTGAAVEDFNRMVGERQRNAALLSIRSQVAEGEASADYLRKAGDFALEMGYLGAGVESAVRCVEGAEYPRRRGGSVSSDPRRIGALY
jgi:hypothetical protein